MEQIASAAHLEMALDLVSEVCYTEENSVRECRNDDKHLLRREHRQPSLSPGTAQAGGALNAMDCRILCYGDSNTYGYDPRSCLGGRYPERVRWTALLQSQGWEVFNAGQNGRAIPRNDWEIEPLIQTLCRHQPDITTVMLGTNDLLQGPGISASDCAGRMARFLSALLEQAPPSRFLLIAPPPMTLGAWVDDPKIVETSQCLGTHYRTAAQKLGIAFANAGDWNVELTYDGVHFSERGHWGFFSGIRKRLSELEGGAL